MSSPDRGNSNKAKKKQVEKFKRDETPERKYKKENHFQEPIIQDIYQHESDLFSYDHRKYIEAEKRHQKKQKNYLSEEEEFGYHKPHSPSRHKSPSRLPKHSSPRTPSPTKTPPPNSHQKSPSKSPNKSSSQMKRQPSPAIHSPRQEDDNPDNWTAHRHRTGNIYYYNEKLVYYI